MNQTMREDYIKLLMYNGRVSNLSLGFLIILACSSLSNIDKSFCIPFSDPKYYGKLRSTLGIAFIPISLLFKS